MEIVGVRVGPAIMVALAVVEESMLGEVVEESMQGDGEQERPRVARMEGEAATLKVSDAERLGEGVVDGDDETVARKI